MDEAQRNRAYWAAKELTRIQRDGQQITFTAPFAAPRFTVRLKAQSKRPRTLTTAGGPAVALKAVRGALALTPGTYWEEQGEILVCFDLAKGKNALQV